MIKLTTEQAQQIEEALQNLIIYSYHDGKKSTPYKAVDSAGVEAIAIIRAAIAQEQAEQEPVAILKPWSYGGSTGVNDYLMSDGSIRALTPDEARAINAAPQPVQDIMEAVDAAMAEMQNINPPLRRSECERLIRAANYAAPVRTKDLTDEELDALWHGNTEGGWRGLFRAVIAADRERNRG